MPRQVSPANAWCFTLNNYSESEYEFLSSEFRNKSEKYFYIVGKEVGESGTPHLQGYIALKDKSKKFRPLPTFAVKREEGKNAMHFERARGNREQNYKYCSKDGNFITNITPAAEQLEQAERILKKAKAMQERIAKLHDRIQDVFVGVQCEADYDTCYDIAKEDIEERNELVEEFHRLDYDLIPGV